MKKAIKIGAKAIWTQTFPEGESRIPVEILAPTHAGNKTEALVVIRAADAHADEDELYSIPHTDLEVCK